MSDFTVPSVKASLAICRTLRRIERESYVAQNTPMEDLPLLVGRKGQTKTAAEIVEKRLKENTRFENL
jgi:hypothetical protein